MDSNTALFAGALDQLMRHSLTGCEKAAHQAARLLDALSERADVDSDTRRLCGRMCDKLEAGEGMERQRVSRQGVSRQGVSHV